MSRSSDAPISRLDQDRLGYAHFARALALGIARRLDSTEGYVVGIEGKWGMGKTSAVNLVVAAIEENQINVDALKRTFVIKLDLWPASGADILAKSY